MSELRADRAYGGDPDARRNPISRDHIRDKFQEIKGGFDQTAEVARTPALGTAILVGAALVVLAFWLGRRRGRASRTVVEIRRV